MSPPIVILGAGGHARVVADICRSIGRVVEGFLDPGLEPGTSVDGMPVLGSDERLTDSDFVGAHEFGLGIGDSRLRCEVGRRVLDAGGTLPALTHERSVVAPDVVIGFGSVLMAGAIVNTGAELGAFVVVNTGASVDHDCRLDEGTHVGPGVHLAGAVRSGRIAEIGIGASVVQGISIGDGAIVGAGATVIRDVPPDTTVAGCPARPLPRTTRT